MIPLVASLIKIGAPILAGAVAAKGKELVEEHLGVDIDSTLASDEGRIKLRQLEIAHEEFLGRLIQESKALDFKYFETEVADRQSARVRDTQLQLAGKRNLRADSMVLLAVVMIVLILLGIWRYTDMDDFAKATITLILGRFLGYLDTVYQFEFGSTRDSQTKNATIAQLSKDRNEPGG